ncbi:hypothetical protein LF41_1025 [Lysobacter dokdonensis DS-58]|uniref:Uncharacterized protein n=1 Tax=Lysobacter dokdonensis DS-58 TaxID=1300345 RepID=A0A0A2WL07_9GAMM|nr:hypothetical protein LF41_1025 [Lysobacter dokdonensis DS-58]
MTDSCVGWTTRTTSEHAADRHGGQKKDGGLPAAVFGVACRLTDYCCAGAPAASAAAVEAAAGAAAVEAAGAVIEAAGIAVDGIAGVIAAAGAPMVAAAAAVAETAGAASSFFLQPTRATASSAPQARASLVLVSLRI